MVFNSLKGSKHCLNLDDSTFTIFFNYSDRNCAGKLLSVISEILGLFVDTLTVDDKYCLANKENLLQPIQMQLPHKEQNLSQFLAWFIKSKSNFENFKKKMTS